MTKAIDHETEQMMTATTGHEHACWDEFTERALEAWAEREGLDIDNLPIAGRHDDLIDGMTLWERYTVEVLVEEKACYCQDRDDEQE